MLLGNVLRWETDYLGRQHPVLPAAPGFARKVKPLVRLGERETAAYCVLRGIDYQVEECPMADGQPAPRLQGGAQRRSRTARPGTKAAFLLRLPRARPRALRRRRRATSARRARVRAPRAARRRPATSARSAGCASEAASPVELGEVVSDVARPFAAGDRVLLVDAKRRRHLVTLAEGGEFHTHAGVLEHDDADRRSDEGVDRAHDDGRAPTSRCGRRWPSTCSRCRAARR